MTEQTQPRIDRQSPMGFVPIAEPTARWIRVRFGDRIIADSKRAILLIEYGPGRLPTYYFPQAEVQMDALISKTPGELADGFEYYGLNVGDKFADNAAWIYRQPPPDLAALRDYVSFKWNAMDVWYEEAEEIFVHARDPHKRVDVVGSSRHVEVKIAGETIAETDTPFLLFETGLPTRYYIPQKDVRMELLEPTHLTTQCPYKGIANYWSATVGDQVERNVVWSYGDPIAECPKIKGLLCFYNERTDLYVDGELQARPVTPWSR